MHGTWEIPGSPESGSIPKADGRQRPLGVTALEDKIVQRATVEVMNAIYEADFLGFSYGFRPGRSQHQALDALFRGLYEKRLNWVLDLDVRSFFDRESETGRDSMRTIKYAFALALMATVLATGSMLIRVGKSVHGSRCELV